MPFIFYDTETTGTPTSFDQILQFAAIKTDDALIRHLRPVERSARDGGDLAGTQNRTSPTVPPRMDVGCKFLLH